MAVTRVVDKHGRCTEYERRRPEQSTLYRIVQDNIQTLFAEAEARSELGFGYPAHVKREFLRYMSCGILSAGFARISCAGQGCKFERLVAYSCKGRCICPSCVARRMADGAAHLVDRVLPVVAGYRQWTLSLPYRVRLRIGYDKARLSKVLAIYLRTVFAWQRTRARRVGISKPLCGAVTLCQRFGSLLQFSPHFHSWLPDGVFYVAPAGEVAFQRLDPPEDRDVQMLVARIEQRIDRFLDEDDCADADDEQAALALERDRTLTPPMSMLPLQRPLCATSNGYSLHADLAVHADERKKLERGLRYGLRYPFAQRRLSQRPDGKVVLQLRKPYFTGQTVIVLEPLEFLRRLAATIPPRRLNMLRFHGVFAPNAKVRPALAALLPKPPAAKATSAGDVAVNSTEPTEGDAPAKRDVPWSYRRPWAELLKRVFDIDDILQCPQCGSKMRNISHIEQPATIARILEHLGLPSTAPPIAPARAPPQLDLDLDAEYPVADNWA
jgi:hypothetical protein